MNEERELPPARPGSARSCPTRWIRPWSSPLRTVWPTPCTRRSSSRTYKLKAHDEQNELRHRRYRVKVMETRPLSKDKRWRVVEIIEKAK